MWFWFHMLVMSLRKHHLHPLTVHSLSAYSYALKLIIGNCFMELVAVVLCLFSPSLPPSRCDKRLSATLHTLEPQSTPSAVLHCTDHLGECVSVWIRCMVLFNHFHSIFFRSSRPLSIILFWCSNSSWLLFFCFQMFL